MKIVHVGWQGDGTGVAIAIRRLHRGLLELGHDSSILVGEVRDPASDPRIQLVYGRASLWGRARRRLRRVLVQRSWRGYQVAEADKTVGFHDDRGFFDREIVHAIPSCDVIALHAMVGWLDYRAFFGAAAERALIVPIMHDMAFFTGGCHYSAGCTKFIDSCGACPVLVSNRERDLSRAVWTRKRSIYASVPRGRVHFVAPSRWVAEEAKRSSLLRGFPVSVIPNGVDTLFFTPRDRLASRELLGIPTNAEVVLFVGEPVTRVTKGFALLAEALGRISRKKLVLVSVGSGAPPAAVSTPHIHLGHVADEYLLPIIYSAADLFVIPSLQENCPQTVLEAIACGVPVVGFATGGIVDQVRPGVSGTLVATGDVEGLSQAVLDMLVDAGGREQMGRNARQIAVEEFSLERQARRYASLFEALVRGIPDRLTALPQAESFASF